MVRNWTKEEEQFLIDNYGKLSRNEIEKGLFKINDMQFGRSWKAIYSKAKTMNLERNIKVKSTFNGVYLFNKPLSKIDAKNHYIYKINKG